MEKKKLLLVAISVGIFLVIAIGAAVVFTPKSPTATSGATTSRGNPANITVAPSPSYLPPVSGLDAPAPASAPAATSAPESPQPAPVDAVDIVRTTGDVPGLKTAPEGTNRQGSDYYINGASRSSPGKTPDTVISVPKPSTVAVPDAAPNVVPERKAAPAPIAQKPAVSAPAAPKPVVQAKPKITAPVQPKLYNDYWVQTGAFSTVATAEGVKETLASRGISSIIENRDVDGKTWFRVRVGPYTTQNEADYWLSLIKTLNGFESSQVRMTQSKR